MTTVREGYAQLNFLRSTRRPPQEAGIKKARGLSLPLFGE